jgi:2-amino-4-hydroxy-6-hydroxymethyldihydropteridine diphosphokinase
MAGPHEMVIMRALVFLALGGNQSGVWGDPVAAFRQAMRVFEHYHVQVVAQSGIYSTSPSGGGRQNRYTNAVIAVRSPYPPAALLRVLKRIERQAGRRTGRIWGPRPLDLDIIDFGGRTLGWPCRRRTAGRLILPHPEMHARAFVLVPLIDIAPVWRHPALGQTARQLLARCHSSGGNVRYMLDFPDPA